MKFLCGEIEDVFFKLCIVTNFEHLSYCGSVHLQSVATPALPEYQLLICSVPQSLTETHNAMCINLNTTTGHTHFD